MKIGTLVRVLSTAKWVPHNVFAGDYAILVSIDWDKTTHPYGIKDRDGNVMTGRGRFLFLNKFEADDFVHQKANIKMMLYESFDVISEAR